MAKVVVEPSLLGDGATVSEFMESRDEEKQETGLVLAQGHAVIPVLFQTTWPAMLSLSGPPANPVSSLTHFNE